jgi:cell division protein FtsQ
MQNPWVRAVKVKRELPDTVRITVHERRAAFLVPQEGTLWYADLEGTLIAPVDPNRFRSLPQLVVEQAEGQALVGPSDMGVLARDLRAAGLPFGLDDAAWVRLSYGAGLELEISGRVLSIGLDGWDENLQRLRAVWQDLERRGELAGIRSIRAHGNRVCAVRAHG